MAFARIESPSGLRFCVNANGSLERIEWGDITLNTFIGTEIEGGPANLYLRRLDGPARFTPLLGPTSPAAFDITPEGLVASGVWEDVRFRVELKLARAEPSWFWHVALAHAGERTARVDLVYAQDVSLAHYGAIRNNEYYTSQYVDWTPLEHPARGVVLAARQNLSMAGRNPWAVFGALGRTVSYATDALDLYGLARRTGESPTGLIAERLPGRRRQHEHAMAVLQHAPITLEPRRATATGFFGAFVPHHEGASTPEDSVRVDATLALPEARVAQTTTGDTEGQCAPRSLFSHGAALAVTGLVERDVDALFTRERRCEEHGEGGGLHSFFHGADRHVVLRAKEERVLRPHGAILRTGRALVPDEAALSTTTWMCGVTSSLLTQGHVNINRFVSATHGYLALAKSDGQRVFFETPRGYELLDMPSAFEMSPGACRWIYKHEGGLVEARTAASLDRHEIELSLTVREGEPARFLVSTRVALNGDDGAADPPVIFAHEGDAVVVRPQASSDIGRRFPDGSFRIEARAGTRLERVGGDELLYLEGKGRGEPYVVLVTAPARSATLRITGHLLDAKPAPDESTVARSTTDAEYSRRCAGDVTLTAPASAPLSDDTQRLGELLPWLARDALVHYLAPHGLEQYAGGGWGTRDICQGPVELLLALGEHAVLRDLLLRVFAAQNPDGDWPQWFMFFDRERSIRAPDSHGDIAFWPLLALGEYLVASEDETILDVRVPFYAEASTQAETAPLSMHVARTLELVSRRVIPGTQLAAYGNGDWNDALQPADPAMKERLASAWTVTLHDFTLRTLAGGLRAVGRAGDAEPLERTAAAVRADFQRLLVVDEVVAGLAYFHADGHVEPFLHPRDRATGISYSLLPMIHGILWDVFTPADATRHADLIRTHLLAADGARLFDAPTRYQGGPQRYFQRAESSSFFGREIGVMYTHAHLRYAEAMARLGDADAFFLALRQANPIALSSVVPTARPRQANCYYSSSDAAFADRYEAAARYADVKSGRVAFEGGWRVYSSGPGIALRLIHERFLGFERRRSTLLIDPVVPTSLDGMEAELTLYGQRVRARYRTRSKGCGPLALTLNGAPLRFERAPNPYRTGAARVAVEDFTSRLDERVNALEIALE